MRRSHMLLTTVCVALAVAAALPAVALASWVKEASGTTRPLDAISFVDTLHGWAVGGSGSIPIVRHTTDGGLTWRSQATGAHHALHAVCFVDRLHGWAVGDGGTIVRTTDGGATWPSRARARPSRCSASSSRTPTTVGPAATAARCQTAACCCAPPTAAAPGSRRRCTAVGPERHRVRQPHARLAGHGRQAGPAERRPAHGGRRPDLDSRSGASRAPTPATSTRSASPAAPPATPRTAGSWAGTTAR